MKKINLSVSFILLLFLSISFYSSESSKVYLVNADPFVGIAVTSHGVLLDVGNLQLTLEEAEVVFDISYLIEDVTYIYTTNSTVSDTHLIVYDFYSTFLIHNSNETINATVGIPLTSNYPYQEDSNGWYWSYENSLGLKIKMNESDVDYEVFNLDDEEIYNTTFKDVIEETFGVPLNFIGTFYELAIFNIAFESDSFYNLTYTYSNGRKRGPYGDCEHLYYMSEISVYYNIGTARAWNHNINESVLMSVTGTQPDHCIGVCEILQHPDKVEYLWEWNDEPVTEDYVGVNYEFEELKCVTFRIWSSILMCLLISGLVIKKKRKKC